jgi:hypothetical protein
MNREGSEGTVVAGNASDRLLGLTLGPVRILDARGRSHMCGQVGRPLLGRGAGGRSPGYHPSNVV